MGNRGHATSECCFHTYSGVFIIFLMSEDIKCPGHALPPDSGLTKVSLIQHWLAQTGLK